MFENTARVRGCETKMDFGYSWELYATGLDESFSILPAVEGILALSPGVARSIPIAGVWQDDLGLGLAKESYDISRIGGLACQAKPGSTIPLAIENQTSARMLASWL